MAQRPGPADVSTQYRKAMAQYWARAVQSPAMGPTPMPCEPFLPHAVDNMQRTDCARRRECVNYSAGLGWKAFTCSVCAVRETAAKTEAPTRVPYLGSYPTGRP